MVLVSVRDLFAGAPNGESGVEECELERRIHALLHGAGVSDPDDVESWAMERLAGDWFAFRALS